MGSLIATVPAGACRLTLAALAGVWLLPLAGCSKTSDGTVILPKPPAVSSLMPTTPLVPSWMRRRQQPQTYEAVYAEDEFPTPPSSPPAAKRRIKPVMVRRDSSGKLACSNQAGANGRVRVVCK